MKRTAKNVNVFLEYNDDEELPNIILKISKPDGVTIFETLYASVSSTTVISNEPESWDEIK